MKLRSKILERCGCVLVFSTKTVLQTLLVVLVLRLTAVLPFVQILEFRIRSIPDSQPYLNIEIPIPTPPEELPVPGQTNPPQEKLIPRVLEEDLIEEDVFDLKNDNTSINLNALT